MKRREFISWTAAGVAIALANRYLSPQVVALDSGSNCSPLFRFAAIEDVGKGNIGQMAIAEVMNDYYQQSPLELVLMAGDNIYEDGNNGNIRRVAATFRGCLKSYLCS